jgi:hypothetical protein
MRTPVQDFKRNVTIIGGDASAVELRIQFIDRSAIAKRSPKIRRGGVTD